LTLPDSNSRVQAVLDGQGIGLWDDLVAPEVDAGTLVPLTDTKPEGAGYHVVFPGEALSPGARSMLA
jgi:DNA-binding transcriptional LysR family regulator